MPFRPALDLKLLAQIFRKESLDNQNPPFFVDTFINALKVIVPSKRLLQKNHFPLPRSLHHVILVFRSATGLWLSLLPCRRGVIIPVQHTVIFEEDNHITIYYNLHPLQLDLSISFETIRALFSTFHQESYFL